MTALHLDSLTFARPGGFTLGPVTLSVAHASLTALVGPSGSGKTTLLRCIAGLESPSSGTIRFGDRVVAAKGVRVPAEQRRIGFVFQSGALWPHMTALQHLTFAAPNRSQSQVREVLATVGLAEHASRRPAELSAGEGKRLALARAIVGDPEVLLLDEPLHSVDVHLRDELGLLVRRIAAERGLTSIVVTHDRDEALSMADDLVVLREGAIVETGRASDLLVAPRTSYAAAFVSGATCLPARSVGVGRYATAFGELAATGAGADEVQLVLLPGDVREAASGQGGVPARVLRAERNELGSTAVVELAGRSVRVLCDRPPGVGTTISVRLAGAPRLLPTGSLARKEALPCG